MGAPKGLPADVKDKLNQCFQQVAQDADYRTQIEERNLIFTPVNAAEAEAFVRGEFDAVQKLWESDPWIK